MFTLLSVRLRGLYIGSSVNMGDRLVDHLIKGNFNKSLQNAIAKYGLDKFVFDVAEFCEPELLLQREQHYFDILFTFPADLRYNFLPKVQRTFGFKHSAETKMPLALFALL